VAVCEGVWHYCPVIADRNALHKHAWIAALAGLLISALMFAFSWRYLDPFAFLAWPDFLCWPQYIGWVAGILLGGHDESRGRIAAIAIPVNAVIYAAVIFCVTRIVVRLRRAA
jgi:hypothetical protein